MKKLCLLLSLWVTAGQAQLSCDDLDVLAGDLDDLAVALESVTDIGHDTPLDATLGDLTQALEAVASLPDALKSDERASAEAL